MENTLSTIGFSIRNQVKGFFSSDDERIDIEFIYKKIRDVRSLLIKNKIKEDKRLDPAFYQKTCCLEIKCKSLICNGVDSGEVEYYVELPALEDIGGLAIQYLGSPDMKTPFNERNYSGFLYGNASPYTGKKPSFTIVENMAILQNLPTRGMKYICIVAVLEDPLKDGCFSITENDPYPISGNMIHELELIVIKQLMSVLNVIPDERNNASNSPLEDNKQV